MNDLLTSFNDIENRGAPSLLQEAVKCYKHNLYRSAIIMSWMAAVYILYGHVCAKHLDEFNTEARSKDKAWRDAKTTDDLGRMKEALFLERIESLSIISRVVKDQLRICLNLRNSCSHPSSLEISPKIVDAHFEILLQNVFKKFQFIVPSKKPKIITIELIQEEVIEFFDLTAEELKSVQKQKRVSEPRQIAMFLSRKYTSSSFPEIGSKFGGRNHSTVVHAVNNIKKKIKQDPNVFNAVSEISFILESMISESDRPENLSKIS